MRIENEDDIPRGPLATGGSEVPLYPLRGVTGAWVASMEQLRRVALSCLSATADVVLKTRSRVLTSSVRAGLSRPDWTSCVITGLPPQGANFVNALTGMDICVDTLSSSVTIRRSTGISGLNASRLRIRLLKLVKEQAGNNDLSIQFQFYGKDDFQPSTDSSLER